MLRILLRIALMVSLPLALLLVCTLALARVSQRPLPPVFYSKNRALYTVQTGCESPLQPCPPHEQRLLGSQLYSIPVVTLSPDGQYIAAHLTSGWGIYRLTCLLASPDCDPVVLDPSSNEVRAGWGPDGSVLALGAASGSQINLFTRGCWDDSPDETCLRRSVTVSTGSGLEQQDWSADGSTMLFINHRPVGLTVLDMRCLDNPPDCLNVQQVFLVLPLLPEWPSLSPDGSQVIFAADPSRNGNQEALFMLDVSSGDIHQLTFGSRVSLNPDWSNDGRYVVFVGYEAPRSIDLKLYMLDLERGLTVLFLHQPGQNPNIPVWGAAP